MGEKSFAIVFVVTMLFLSGTARALDVNRAPVLMLSEGLSTCGEYIAEPEKQTIRMEWVLGYISGANSRAPAPEAMAGSSFQMPATALGWLQSYCASHPLDVMASAAEVLRRDFLARERR